MPTVANAIRALEAHPGTAVITGFDLERCEFTVTVGETRVPFGWDENGDTACVIIAQEFGVHPSLVKSRVRTESVAHARHAWVLALRLSGLSYERISKITGRGCHGASLNSVQRAVAFIGNDHGFRSKWQRAAERLGLSTRPTQSDVDNCQPAGRNGPAVK